MPVSNKHTHVHTHIHIHAYGENTKIPKIYKGVIYSSFRIVIILEKRGKRKG